MTVVHRTSQESPTSTQPSVEDDPPTNDNLRPAVQERQAVDAAEAPVEEPTADDPRDEVTDLTDETRETEETGDTEPAADVDGPATAQELRELRELRIRGPKGLRIRRIRIKSVLKIATVFFLLGYLVTIGTLVALWNVAQQLGFVESVEETLVTSLGLETFEVVGQDLFDLAVVGFGILFAMGLVITVLLTVVYNATCALFGGLAVETGSLRRPKRVFSLRHRRFITIR